jgi:hypothetical protein
MHLRSQAGRNYDNLTFLYGVQLLTALWASRQEVATPNTCVLVRVILRVCVFVSKPCFEYIVHHLDFGGLLNKSTTWYFYKRLKTSLRKATGNLLENLFSGKCALISTFKNKSFCHKQTQHFKLAFYRTNSTLAKIFNISVFDS